MLCLYDADCYHLMHVDEKQAGLNNGQITLWYGMSLVHSNSIDYIKGEFTNNDTCSPDMNILAWRLNLLVIITNCMWINI